VSYNTIACHKQVTAEKPYCLTYVQPALVTYLPHAYGPVAAAGQEQVGCKRRPLQRIHGPDVAAVRLQVLLTVACAALVDVTVLSA
jgi:hypothetical protein